MYTIYAALYKKSDYMDNIGTLMGHRDLSVGNCCGEEWLCIHHNYSIAVCHSSNSYNKSSASGLRKITYIQNSFAQNLIILKQILHKT